MTGETLLTGASICHFFLALEYEITENMQDFEEGVTLLFWTPLSFAPFPSHILLEDIC